MNIMARLRKLEQKEIDKSAEGKVCFCVEAKGHMWIRELDFIGTSEEARLLMEKYPQHVYIVDDIPHPNWVDGNDDYDGEDLDTWLKSRGGKNGW